MIKLLKSFFSHFLRANLKNIKLNDSTCLFTYLFSMLKLIKLIKTQIEDDLSLGIEIAVQKHPKILKKVWQNDEVALKCLICEKTLENLQSCIEISHHLKQHNFKVFFFCFDLFSWFNIKISKHLLFIQ